MNLEGEGREVAPADYISKRIFEGGAVSGAWYYFSDPGFPIFF